MFKTLFNAIVLILVITNFQVIFAFNPGFIENKGQVLDQNKEIASEVLYILNTKGLKITLREDGFSYERFKSVWSDTKIKSFVADEYANAQIPFESHRIDFTFPNRPSEIKVDRKADFSMNYYNKTQQPVTGVKQYERVLYKNVANGIDIEFLITNSGGFKYNILVDGTADLSSFFMNLSGADDLKIDEEGSLLIDNSIEVIKEEIPESFYVVNEQIERVEVNYDLEGNKLYFRTSKDFSIGKLIIDPEPDLVWGSYFGGSSSDVSTGLAVDQNDNVLQTGITLSIDNISTTGSFQTNYAGDLDVYVSKFDRFGTLLWSTYYGDEQSERAYSIDVDEKGDAYLGANTFSVTGISTPGVYQEYLAGADDMFILKLNENGLREWCTYYGGSAHDFITTLKFYENKIFVTGHTTSFNGITTSGAYIENYSANECGFIGCLEEDGTALLWGTYLGEELSTSGEDLVVFNGHIACTGRTTSSTGFATLNAHQENHIGFVSGFLSLFDTQGNYQWGTYYGGQYTTVGRSVTVDDLDHIYIAGNSNSLTNIATTGAYQESRSDEHGFLAKFNLQGERIWGTYVGGNLADYIKVVDYYNGNLLIGGYTLSTNDIATAGVYQDELNGGFDIFFKLFDTSGVFEWGTYYGGENNEAINDLGLLANGNFYFVGNTIGSQSYIATPGAHQETYGGGQEDAVIGLFCTKNTLNISLVNGLLIADGGTDIEWFYNGDPLDEYSDTLEPVGNGTYMIVDNIEGKCETSSEEFVLNTSSYSEVSNDNFIKIYPNPVNDFLILESDILFNKAIVYDLSGREIITNYEHAKITKLDVSGLKTGIYVLQIFNNDLKSSLKFVKN